MANCKNKITEDILQDCLDKPKRGLQGSQAVILNWEDINRASSAKAGAVISDIVMKTGESGYTLEWYKDLASANSAFTPNTEDIDGFQHNFLCRLPNTTAADAERAAELSGGLFVMVVKTKYEGADGLSKYKVFGWENGLKLSEMTFNTLENSGQVLYTLATEEGGNEDYPFMIYDTGTLADNDTNFAALFAAV